MKIYFLHNAAQIQLQLANAFVHELVNAAFTLPFAAHIHQNHALPVINEYVQGAR